MITIIYTIKSKKPQVIEYHNETVLGALNRFLDYYQNTLRLSLAEFETLIISQKKE